jgi:hypothetical protein
MQTQLQIIKDVLTNHTAYSFADEKLSAVKKGVSERNENYYEYMYQVFSGAKNPTIEECEENANRQFISEYGKCRELLTGWQKNGSLFILDRKNKIVLFLYKKDKERHSAVSHYNPTNYDCLEWAMSNNRFFAGLENGEFVLSKDEDELIKMCDFLIMDRELINIMYKY